MYICANIPTYATYFKRKSKRKGVEFFFLSGTKQRKSYGGMKVRGKTRKRGTNVVGPWLPPRVPPLMTLSWVE